MSPSPAGRKTGRREGSGGALRRFVDRTIGDLDDGSWIARRRLRLALRDFRLELEATRRTCFFCGKRHRCSVIVHVGTERRWASRRCWQRYSTRPLP